MYLPGGVLNSYKTVNAVAFPGIPSGQKLDTTVDTISVSDLTFDGLSNQTMIGKSDTASFAFGGENVNKSLAFRFIYDCNDTNQDTTTLQISFDVANNPSNEDNSYLLRGDHHYFKRYSTSQSKYQWKENPSVSVGKYEIEFGRIALLNSSTDEPTGNYYVYYMLDGDVIGYDVNPYTVANICPNIKFYFGSSNLYNKLYDTNLTYENPQIVGVADLKRGENYVGLSVADTSQLYTYDTTEQPTNKSTVFVADVDYKVAESSQIYVTSGTGYDYSGLIWFQPDKVYFGLNDADGNVQSPVKYKQFNYKNALVGGSEHTIEYGRLAVMDGESFTGRYHVYLKVDGIKYGFDQKIESTSANGGKVFLTGSSGFDYVESRLETPKEISVRDLKNGSSLVGNTLDIDGRKDLTYNNEDHTDNYSLIFKFKYEAKELKNNQIHLSCTGTDPISTKGYKWTTASSFILNNSDGTKVHLGKSTAELADNKWHDVSYAMSVDTIYDVEFGRIALVYNGVFSGKYYVYLKIDDVLVKFDILSMPSVVPAGNVVFITDDGHNKIYDADYNFTAETAVASINSYMNLGFSFDKDGSTYSNVKCVMGAGIAKAISDDIVAAPYTYGVEVKTSSKTMYYNSELSSDATTYYKLINLGDVINIDGRATDTFTVRAYIEKDGLKYFSTVTKSYSVSTLAQYYLDNAVGLSLNEGQIAAVQALKDALA